MNTYMQRMIKRCFAIVLLAAGLQSSWGYSLLGPYESWQTSDMGYRQAYQGYLWGGLPTWLGDLGGPHNLGEEFRRNVPVVYYAFDASFATEDFFGSKAMAAVDSAAAIMNTMTNVDTFSSELSEFPLNSLHYNQTAQSLYLSDIKSTTLHLLVEQLGLADSARFSWTLRERSPGPSCPMTATYTVVQRNFDVVPSPQNAVQYSPYVNGALLSYYISEECPAVSRATTIPFLVDAEGQEYAPVSANIYQNFDQWDTAQLWHLPTIYGLQIGSFYTGLTRDDVAGLRYLYTTNNVNKEPLAAGSQAFVITTNFNSPQIFPPVGFATTNGAGFYYFDGNTNGGFGYGDLAAFLAFARTNNIASLQAAYPGVIVSSVATSWGMASNATYSSYYTNAGIGSPFGTPPRFVVVTNYTPYWQFLYSYTFANVFTNLPQNHYSTNAVATWQTVSVSVPIGSPYGNPLVTNTTVKLTNQIAGDFFVLPLFHTNVCPLDIVSVGIPTALATTNYLTGGSTNAVTTTNTTSYSNSVYLVTYFTNYSYVAYPVNCGLPTNSVELYQGVGGIKFARANYDSLLSQTFQPVTNDYVMRYVDTASGSWRVRHVLRVEMQPNIIFSAADMATLPVSRSINFDASQQTAGLSGPGIIDSPTVFTFNKVGRAYFNAGFTNADSFINPYQVNETTQFPLLQWASFDASTNDPVVYPNGTSVQNMEYQMIINVSPSVIPTNSAAYYSTNGVQFSAAGGSFQPPFTWSNSSVPGIPGSGLPSGLKVSSSGWLSGSTANAGTFDFTLRLTDSLSRSVQWIYSITIK